MFEIKVFNEIPKELADEEVKQKQLAFSERPLTDSLRHADQYSSKQDRIKYLLAFDRDQIIGGLILLKRKIKYHGSDLLLGGIGGVWTRESRRRQGVSTALLTEGMKILKEVDCDIAYLCTDAERLGKLYRRVGFEKLRKQYTVLGKSGERYYSWGGMIAPVNSQEIFENVLNSNESFDIGQGDW